MELEIFGTTMNAWQIFVSAGVLLIIWEIFAPGFIFLPIGITCLTTAIFVPFIESTNIQLLLFAFELVIIFFIFQKIIKPRLKKDQFTTNVDSMVGKQVTVSEDILPNGSKGKIKLYSDQWTAMSEEKEALPKGTSVIISRIEGNKVFVKKA